MEAPMLSFEKFSQKTDRIPSYNNFHLYFCPWNSFGQHYQKKEHYQRFEKENPELAKSLCEKMRIEMRTTDYCGPISKSLEKEIYEAYKIMSGYGIEDWLLFR